MTSPAGRPPCGRAAPQDRGATGGSHSSASRRENRAPGCARQRAPCRRPCPTLRAAPGPLAGGSSSPLPRAPCLEPPALAPCLDQRAPGLRRGRLDREGRA
jgi:hypothetical protein